MGKAPGDIIREARKAKGWTQAELAPRVNVSDEYISHLERGIRLPSVDLAIRLSRVLGIEPRPLCRAAVLHKDPELAGIL